MSIEELGTKNGHYEVEGKVFVLLEQANFQSDPKSSTNGWEFDNYYSARAICLDDKMDEDGYQKCYKIRWEILDTYNPKYDGEDCACEWDSFIITEHGEYSLETGCYY